MLLCAVALSAGAQTTVAIGAAGGTTTNSYYPIYSCYGYSYTQQIITAAEMAMPNGGTLNKIRFFYSTAALTPTTYNNWTIYIGQTAVSSFATSSSWIPVSGMTQVFTGAPTFTVGTWIEFTLSTPFAYNGTSNIVIGVDENAASYSCTAAWRSYTAGTGKGLVYYSDGTNPDPAAPPAASLTSTVVAQVQFDATLPPCTGTPNAGSIATTTQTLCAGTVPTAIAATGLSIGTGITYQWEESANNTTWVNAVGGSGATTDTYTPPAMGTSVIYYRLKTTCTASSTTNTSNAKTLTPLTGGPATQASNMVFTMNATLNGATISCTNGSGNGRYIVLSNAPIVDPAPNATPAAANTVYSGSGQQVVALGAVTSVTVSGLNCNTTYYTKVYEYNVCSGSYTALVSSATNNPISASVASAAALGYTQDFGTLTALPTGWVNLTSSFLVAASHGKTGSGAYANCYSSVPTRSMRTQKLGPVPANALLTFESRVLDFSLYPASAPAAGWGSLQVAVSTDCGTTYATVGTFTDLSGAAWLTKSVDLSAYSGQSIYIRFLGSWTAGDWYVDIDNISLIQACSGTPATTTVTSSANAFCPTIPTAITLGATGLPAASGYVYNWQSSPDGSAWTSTGVTTLAYSPTPTAAIQYRLAVTCSFSSLTSTSAPLSLSAGTPPVAGTATGPATAFTYDAANTVYNLTGNTGTIQWVGGTAAAPTAVITGATAATMNLNFNGASTFYVRARVSSGGCPDVFSNEINTVVTVMNDNVCNAINLNIGNNAGPYTSIGATFQAGEVAPPVTGGTNTQQTWTGTVSSSSIWFKFTVPTGGSGRYTFAAPGWDSQIAIWNAASCSNIAAFTFLAGNDDWGTAITPINTGNSTTTTFSSLVQGYCLTPGTTYYISVDGYGTNTNSNINILVTDLGAVDYTGLPATSCITAAPVTLTPTPAGGTFSGTGVTGASFSAATAGAGTFAVNYAYLNNYVSNTATVLGPACTTNVSKSVAVAGTATYYADADGDTYGNAASSSVTCTTAQPANTVTNSTDCDDTRTDINPGASEKCDATDTDEDCDGAADDMEVGDNATGQINYYADNDVDGYGAGAAMNMCNQPAGSQTNNTDCNDTRADVSPADPEVCDTNDVDEDCDGASDDTEVGDNALGQINYYADADGDTYGVNPAMNMCNQPAGSATLTGDCQPNDAASYPGVTENLCDNIDNDCNNLVNDLAPGVACVGVSGISVSGIAKTRANINWASQCGISQTRIQYRKASSNVWTYATANVPVTSKLIYNLTGATQYAYRLRNTCGLATLVSTLSPEAYFTTLAADLAPETADEKETAETSRATASSVRVFPNPAQGMVFVELNDIAEQTVAIQLFDQSGKTAITWNADAKNGQLRTQFDATNLPSGVYVVRMQTTEGSVLRSIIKQ